MNFVYVGGTPTTLLRGTEMTWERGIRGLVSTDMIPPPETAPPPPEPPDYDDEGPTTVIPEMWVAVFGFTMKVR